MLTIFLVNLNAHWAYKDCQFNNRILIVKIAGSFPFGAVVHGTCIYICEALRDCFTFISMLKFPAGKRKFTPPSFGKEYKRGNAVKILL